MRDVSVFPVELIAGDEATARVIARRQAKGGSLIIDGRLYFEEHEEAGRPQLRLRVVAEQVIVLENQPEISVASR